MWHVANGWPPTYTLSGSRAANLANILAFNMQRRPQSPQTSSIFGLRRAKNKGSTACSATSVPSGEGGGAMNATEHVAQWRSRPTSVSATAARLRNSCSRSRRVGADTNSAHEWARRNPRRDGLQSVSCCSRMWEQVRSHNFEGATKIAIGRENLNTTRALSVGNKDASKVPDTGSSRLATATGSRPHVCSTSPSNANPCHRCVGLYPLPSRRLPASCSAAEPNRHDECRTL